MTSKSSLCFDEQQLIQMPRVGAITASKTHLYFEVQTLDSDHQSSYGTQLWRADASAPSSTPVPLTRGSSSNHSPKIWNNGELLFLSNRPPEGAKQEGHEQRSQVWRMPGQGGDPECLTDLPRGVQSFTTAAKANVLAMLHTRLPGVPEEEQRETTAERQKHGPSALRYTEMPVRFWDHWIPNNTHHISLMIGDILVELDPPEGAKDSSSSELCLSPDGKTLAVTRKHRQGNYGLHDNVIDIIDVGTRKRLHRIEHLSHSHHNLVFDATGNKLACARHILNPDTQEFYTEDVIVFDIPSQTLTTHTPDLDLSFYPSLFSSSSTLVGIADWQGTTSIFSLDLSNNTISSVSPHQGTHGSVCGVDGTDTFVSVHSSILEPPAPCLTTQGATTRISHLTDDLLDPAWATLENHQVKSTDGEMCQYFVVTPEEAIANKGAVMWIHGGPISSWADTWHWRWNSLVGVARGYTMVLPNPRGSTGFGRSWVEGIWGNVWGGQCYEDLMCVADQVSQREDVDDSKFAAMGGSFGGYMTNWIGTQTDRFSCLINHAGLTNLRAFYDITDNPSWWEMMFGINPWTEAKALERYSPLEHISGWKSPALIIHGDKDYRVPVGEALAVFNALQAHAVESELLIYPDENHWILKPRNIVSWYEAVFEFIGRHAELT